MSSSSLSSSSAHSSRTSSPETPPRLNQQYQALTNEELEALPSPSNVDSQDCSICFTDINGSKIRTLPCLHNFHETCIFPWLKVHPNCPMCRYQLKESVSHSQFEVWQLMAVNQENVIHENILSESEFMSGPARNTRSRIFGRTYRNQQ